MPNVCELCGVDAQLWTYGHLLPAGCTGPRGACEPTGPLPDSPEHNCHHGLTACTGTGTCTCSLEADILRSVATIGVVEGLLKPVPFISPHRSARTRFQKRWWAVERAWGHGL